MPPAPGSFYTDGQMPRTPKHDQHDLSPSDPPPPPRQTYKVKRKRVVTQPPCTDILESEQIIPTIEMSEPLNASPDLSSPMLDLTPSNGLLAPVSHIMRSLTPPKTPASHHNSFGLESPGREWDLITDTNGRKPFERTGSIGSSFSDSSLSSLGSSAFTSPDSEAADPFMEDEIHNKTAIYTTFEDRPDAKRAKTNRRAMWTTAMDDHLWLTYMAYLSDPTLTPFKMLPGTAPPLGVCHRVASKAKRTWREHRTFSATTSLDSIFQRQGSPDTIRAESSKMAQLRNMQWPRSESETRRRLRALCKRRPSLSAHYQRLLRTRSPSPFQSSATRASEPPTTFSSTDMKISLITSTSATMQPDGPLAQLISEDMPAGPQPPRASRPADWFARIGRSQAHQKSLSLQSGLGLDTKAPAPLASPFDDVSSRSHLLQSSSTTKSLGRDFNRSAPFLDSPFEGAPTAPRSLKRRFRSDEEKPKRPLLQGIFGHSDSAVRSRGFSLGTSELTSIFDAPSLDSPVALQAPTPCSVQQDHDMLDTPDLAMLGPPGSRSAPRRLAEPTPRLGSPFVEAAASRQFNTFPRSYVPSSSNPQPFQQRLQQLMSEQQPQKDA